jgi:hypothetical protein
MQPRRSAGERAAPGHALALLAGCQMSSGMVARGWLRNVLIALMGRIPASGIKGGDRRRSSQQTQGGSHPDPP